MRDGGVLGFSCHHVYVFDQLNTDTPLLKGADCIVYLVAKSLGLSVMVKPIYDGEWKGKKRSIFSPSSLALKIAFLRVMGTVKVLLCETLCKS